MWLLLGLGLATALRPVGAKRRKVGLGVFLAAGTALCETPLPVRGGIARARFVPRVAPAKRGLHPGLQRCARWGEVAERRFGCLPRSGCSPKDRVLSGYCDPRTQTGRRTRAGGVWVGKGMKQARGRVATLLVVRSVSGTGSGGIEPVAAFVRRGRKVKSFTRSRVCRGAWGQRNIGPAERSCGACASPPRRIGRRKNHFRRSRRCRGSSREWEMIAGAGEGAESVAPPAVVARVLGVKRGGPGSSGVRAKSRACRADHVRSTKPGPIRACHEGRAEGSVCFGRISDDHQLRAWRGMPGGDR